MWTLSDKAEMSTQIVIKKWDHIWHLINIHIENNAVTDQNPLTLTSCLSYQQILQIKGLAHHTRELLINRKVIYCLTKCSIHCLTKDALECNREGLCIIHALYVFYMPYVYYTYPMCILHTLCVFYMPCVYSTCPVCYMLFDDVAYV